MKNRFGQKRRPAGSVHEAIADAFADLEGGVTKAAERLELSRPYVTAMADPDAQGRHKVNMTLQQAGRLSEGGATTALAEWLAVKAGGIFLPGSVEHCAAAIQEAVANYSRESGEGIAATLEAALAGGDLDHALRELLETHAALGRLIAKLQAGASVTQLRGAA